MEVIEIFCEAIAVEPFREPARAEAKRRWGWRPIDHRLVFRRQGRIARARCSGRIHGCHRRRSTLRWVENFDFVWRLGSPEFGSMGNL